MSVTNLTNKVNYSASGLTVYAIPFYFSKNEHVKLYVDDVLKVLNTDFTVSGADNEMGGNLTILGTPPSSGIITIIREIPLDQENSFNEGGNFGAKTIERMFDKLTHISQQIDEKIKRSIKFPFTSNADAQLTGAVVPGALLEVNPAGTGLQLGPSTTSLISDMAGSLAGSEAARDASEGFRDEAEGFRNEAEGFAQNSSDSADASEISAQNSETSAQNAANAEAAVQLALNSVGWQDVIPTNMNLDLNETHNGCMILVDCSSGPVQIKLPPISNLDLVFPFSIGIKKSDSSGNSITVIRDNTDLIDGGTSFTIGTSGSGSVFIPDADTSPNTWTSVAFGATAGNLTKDTFNGTGAQTAFTLSVAPGSKNNSQVYIHGVYQDKASYNISGVTLTFTEAPPAGTGNIEVITGTTLPTGVPSDGAVTLSKLAQEVINALVPISTPIFNFNPIVPNGYVSAMNKTLGMSGADYSGATYYALYAILWAMGGLSVDAGHAFRISSTKGSSASNDWAAGKLITMDFETNGVFIRGKSAARALGVYENSDNKAHTHTNPVSNAGVAAGATNTFYAYPTGATANNASSSSGGTESKPNAVSAYVYLKY